MKHSKTDFALSVPLSHYMDTDFSYRAYFPVNYNHDKRDAIENYERYGIVYIESRLHEIFFYFDTQENLIKYQLTYL